MNRTSPSSSRSGQGLDGTAGSVGELELVLLDEVVQLDHVDVVDTHPLQRALQLGARRIARTLTGLGGQEHRVPVLGQPRLQPVLRRAVGRRGVDVVDAPRGDLGHRRVGALLAHPAEGGGTEDHPGRVVSRPPERSGGQLSVHGPTVHAPVSIADRRRI